MGDVACHVLRLGTESECGACGRDVPAGYQVITDQIEAPVCVVVREGCTSGLDGVRLALRLLEARKPRLAQSSDQLTASSRSSPSDLPEAFAIVPYRDRLTRG